MFVALLAELRLQRLGDAAGVGQRADGRAEEVDDLPQQLRSLDGMSLQDVLEIDRLEEGAQVVFPCGVVGAGQAEGHASEAHVVVKGVAAVELDGGEVFGEGEGMEAYLVSASAEFGADIGGEHAGVGAGYIDIQVLQVGEAVEGVVEGDGASLGIVGIGLLVRHLDFVDEEVALAFGVLHPVLDIVGQEERVTEAKAGLGVELEGQDVLLAHALGQQVLPEQGLEQEGLAAAANPRDDLDLAISLIGDELFQISVARDFHKCRRLSSIAVGCRATTYSLPHGLSNLDIER